MKYITVSWYDCDCEWTTKYCDEEHRRYARVPVSVLRTYAYFDPERRENDGY